MFRVIKNMLMSFQEDWADVKASRPWYGTC
jgi:hypothetical protein